MNPASDLERWRKILSAVSEEFGGLPSAERAWIEVRLEKIERLQADLQSLFEKADGADLCRDCGGECCARGKHHLTLANLLAFLSASDLPPIPDFTKTCPFLDSGGCLLPAGRRPFNCVTFLCGAVEERLDPADRDRFYALEKELRRCYDEFARQYAGAGMCGLLIRAERLGDKPLLAPSPGKTRS